jgi:hypothetical protein
MKTVVISGTNWLQQYPPAKRADIIRMIYSLASENHYAIVVAGQHWPK